MRSRPDIELSLPKSITPGGRARVIVTLRSRSETPIDRAEVTLVGVESARIPEQSSSVSERVFHTSSAVLRESGVLAAGDHALEASLDLPAEAPATYIGNFAEVRYSIKARVEIPWWPDAEESAELLVTPVVTARPEARGASTTTEGGDLPILEMAIDARAFAPGDVITGAVAIGGARGADLSGMDVSLAGYERLRLPAWKDRQRVIEAYRHAVFVSVEGAREGREMNFRIPIPKNAAPSFDEGLFALEWVVEANLDVGLARSVVAAIPVVIGPYARSTSDFSADQGRGPAAAPGASASKTRPKIGSSRWRRVWRDVGAAAGLSLTPGALRLTGALHGAKASIAPGEASGARRSVAAELTWPSLGIGLEIEKAGLSLFTTGGAFAKKYRVKSRFPSQAEALLTPTLREALLAFDSIELSDTGARLEMRGPSHEADWLEGLVGRVADVARAASRAARALPPPPMMVAARAAWQAFADELGGRLEVGSMSVRDGRLDGGAFTIETCFEGEASESPDGGPLPSKTRVTLALDPGLPSVIDVATAEGLARAPAGVRSIALSIREVASALRASEDRIELDLPAPLMDPSRLREVMRATLVLAERLSGEHSAGPYR